MSFDYYRGLKQLILRWLLDNEPVVRIVVYGPTDGVVLPKPWKDNNAVVLELGYHTPVPIRGFEIDDFGVRATLTFDRVPFDCVVPWNAVVGINGRGLGVGALSDLDSPRTGPQFGGLRVVKGGVE